MKHKDKNNKLRSVTVFLEFDSRLQSVTGISRTSVEVTEGTPFVMLLHAVLDSYPNLARNYAWNMLGFEVNGKTPNPFSLLDANDVISICLSDYENCNDRNFNVYYH